MVSDMRSRRKPRKTRGRKPKRAKRAAEPASHTGKIVRNAKFEFSKLLHARGITGADLAARLNLKPALLWALARGNMSPNHPAIPLIAAALEMPEADVAKYAQRAPMQHEKVIARSARMMVAKRRSKREEVVEAEITPASNGKKPGKALTKVMPAKYNRLKKGAPELRQVARALVGTLNIAVMRGDALLPQIPVTHLYLIMHDWLTEKGVPNVLVDPRFAEFFDRKL